MALKLQVRGTQLDAYYSTGRKDWGSNSANGQSPSLVADASPGVFGGSKIDIRGEVGKNAIAYMGGDNFSLNAVFTILMRVIPTWTGSPSVSRAAVNMNMGETSFNMGLLVRFTSAGKVQVHMRNVSNTSIVNDDSSGTIPWEAGVPTDVWISWSGAGASDALKIYYRKHGESSATEIGSIAVSSPGFTERKRPQNGVILIGVNEYDAVAQYYLNEFCVWDTVESPSTYGERTNFVSAPNLEGANTESVSASQLIAGVTKIQNGVSVVGSVIAAAAATTKHGVSANDGTGSYRGADLNGALAADKILAGNSQLQDGVTVNGTAIAAAAATTKVGVTANDGPGTYDGSERYTDFGNANIAAGVAGKYNSTTNNRLGTLQNVTNIHARGVLLGKGKAVLVGGDD